MTELLQAIFFPVLSAPKLKISFECSNHYKALFMANRFSSNCAISTGFYLG